MVQTLIKYYIMVIYLSFVPNKLIGLAIGHLSDIIILKLLSYVN